MIGLVAILASCNPAARLEDVPGYAWLPAGPECRIPVLLGRGADDVRVVHQMGQVCVRRGDPADPPGADTRRHACGGLVVEVTVPASLPVLAEREWRQEDELARLAERSIAAVCR